MNILTFDKPGSYSLSDDILYSDNATKPYVILITSNDIILHGNSHSVRQVDPSLPDIVGIQILPSVKNITLNNLILDTISGTGISLPYNNTDITINNIKFVHCGYNCNRFSAIYVNQGNNITINKCTFTECGILRSPYLVNKLSHCISVQQSNGVTIKGCAIDGCVGSDCAYGLHLTTTDDIMCSDNVITDIISSGKAEGVYSYDISGELKETIWSSIFPFVTPDRYIKLLDTHGVINTQSKHVDTYPLEHMHLKHVIPMSKENFDKLLKEHTWKEFRTLHRLVCHNSHKVSKTAAIYGKWVELFCLHCLDTKVKVEGAFANLYPNGNVPLSRHRDAYEKWVFGLSFGETRTFEFIPDDGSEMVSYLLEDGDLFVFSAIVNKYYQHQMSPEPERVGKRINLTYFLEVEGNNRKLLTYNGSPVPSFEEAEAAYNQEATTEKKRVILQDEYGNLYEEINDVIVPIERVS